MVFDALREPAAPQPSLVHLTRMTDGTGLLQHARHDVPDRRHGYCLDDCARALHLVARLAPRPDALALAPTYAAFVEHAWEPDARDGRGRFRNFMAYDRRWLPDGADDGADDGVAGGAEDEEAQARALVALAAVARAPMPGLDAWAIERLVEALRPPALPLAHRSPRAWAQVLIACAVLAEPGDGPAPLREATRLAAPVARELAVRLHACTRAAARSDWPWFEDALAYDNARLCEGALLGATHLPELRAPALAALEWLCELQTGPGGAHRPFGTCGFGVARAREVAFDQQPLEAWATVDACARAHAATGARRWRTEAVRAHAWFLGANELGVALADPDDGGCRDGLHPDRANANRGAESTLAWLHAELTMIRLDERTPAPPGGPDGRSHARARAP